jgi:dCMP deaminase
MTKLTPEKMQKYMSIATQMAGTLSKDPDKQVGSIFLNPTTLHILSSSYNGFPFGIEDRPERWERPTKYKYVCHSEINGICSAAKHGIPLDGAILVVTLFPCSSCTKVLIQTGISLIVTHEPDFAHERWGQDFKHSYELLQEAGIPVRYVPQREN